MQEKKPLGKRKKRQEINNFHKMYTLICYAFSVTVFNT